MNKYARYIPSLQHLKLTTGSISLVGKRYWQHLTILAVILLFMLVTAFSVVSCKPRNANAAENTAFAQSKDVFLSTHAARNENVPISHRVSHRDIREIILPERSFSVWGKPKLIIRNEGGRISIANGTQHRISVHATKYIRGSNINPGDLQVTYSQRGNTIEVVGKMLKNIKQLSYDSHLSIDFEVTMPSSGDIQVQADASDILVRGINGQHTITTDAGVISMFRTRLHSTSTLTARAGTIGFDGSLDPYGRYTFTTQAGAINVALPANAAFRLHATTTIGLVNNEFGSNTVGRGPRPQLILNTIAGLITVQKKP